MGGEEGERARAGLCLAVSALSSAWGSPGRAGSGNLTSVHSRVTFADDHISGHIEGWNDLLGKVRGVVASRRRKGDRVSVWVGDARKLGAVVDVGRMVGCSLILLAISGLAICLILIHQSTKEV